MIATTKRSERVRAVARPLERKPSISMGCDGCWRGPFVARIDFPRTDVSAMDGYAVREIDLQTLPARLQIAGSPRGRRLDRTAEAGECVRIFTGAPVPAASTGSSVRKTSAARIIRWRSSTRFGQRSPIRQRASDFRVGDELLSCRRRLDKLAIVAAAGADLAEVEVYMRRAFRSSAPVTSWPHRARPPPIDAIPESVSLGLQQCGRMCADLSEAPPAGRSCGDARGSLPKL